MALFHFFKQLQLGGSLYEMVKAIELSIHKGTLMQI